MKSKDASAGARVQVKAKGKIYEGILLESYEQGTLLLKLESGYNIGFREKDVNSIKVLHAPEKHSTQKEKEKEGRFIRTN